MKNIFKVGFIFSISFKETEMHTVQKTSHAKEKKNLGKDIICSHFHS